MKLLYTDRNPMMVGNIRNHIEMAGIEVTYLNEYSHGAIGEIAPQEGWLQLWVVNDDEFEQARLIIDNLARVSNAPDWHCANCGEANDPSFEFCWHCNEDKPASD